METDRARDEEFSAGFHYAFDNGAIGMTLIAPEGYFVRANDAFLAMVGRSFEELRDLGPTGVTHPEEQALQQEIWARMLRGELDTFHGERRYVRPDGSLRWGSFAVRLVHGPRGVLGFFTQVVDTTATARARAALRESNERLQLLADASDDFVFFRTRTVPELRIEHVSAGATAIVGYPPGALYANPGLLFQALHPDDRPKLQQALTSEEPVSLTLRYVHPDGRVVWTESRASPWRDDDGTVIGMEGIAYVAAGREVEQAVRAGAERFSSLVQNAADVVTLVGRDGRIEYVSPAFETVLGIPPAEVVGTTAADAVHADDRPALRAAFDRAAPGQSVRVEFRVAHRDGSPRWMDGVVTNLLRDPNVRAYVLNSRDVTEQHYLTEQLRQRAYDDELTGLPNRLGFRDRIEDAIDVGRPFAVLLCATSGLSAIVEVFGHAQADRLVAAAAERLAPVLGAGSCLARIAPAELAVLLPGLDDVAAAMLPAQRLLGGFEEPFLLDGQPFQLDGNVGIALFPAHGTEADVLLRRAGRARRYAEERHVGLAAFSAELDDMSAQHLALLGHVRDAIAGDQFELHYQPKVDLRSRTTYGVEALLRWQHPEFGFVAPDRFVPLAERSGLIRPLTRWVVQAAARQIGDWRRDGIGLTVAVNVTPRNLQDPGFPDEVAEILDACGVPPSALWLELTERAVMTDPENAVAACHRLADLGVALSLDDFGTGQSSFAYVAALPVSEIKIDRRFVDDLAADGANAGITRAIVGLAHHLGHSVIAEGVEDEETLRRLADLGCDAVQGYHVSRPLPPAALRDWLATSPWSG